MMRLEPHTHIHGIELCWETAIGGVDVVTEIFGHLDHLVWRDRDFILEHLLLTERYWPPVTCKNAALAPFRSHYGIHRSLHAGIVRWAIGFKHTIQPNGIGQCIFTPCW